MKAYEFPAKITPEGTLEVPEELLDSFPNNQVVRVILLVNETVEEEQADDNALEFSAESFRQSWHEAITGQTLPLSQLWEGIEVD
ncbi:MAG: hypothetical protein SAK29_16475 [Scytonema sp. PMC 1069.18]|nr:hypothetical protein [Scytonema sp. PMC 1069.18]MEC4884653.1 hypothetical protein [Scytonema sp. PMC 1070.18]